MRIQVKLTDEEIKTLCVMEKQYNRKANNLVSSLLKMSIRAFEDGSKNIFIDDLGVIEKNIK